MRTPPGTRRLERKGKQHDTESLQNLEDRQRRLFLASCLEIPPFRSRLKDRRRRRVQVRIMFRFEDNIGGVEKVGGVEVLTTTDSVCRPRRTKMLLDRAWMYASRDTRRCPASSANVLPRCILGPHGADPVQRSGPRAIASG